jgi:hypothetical protein
LGVHPAGAGLAAASFTDTGGGRQSAQEPQAGRLYRRREEGGPSLLRLDGHLSCVYSSQASISAPMQGGDGNGPAVRAA